MKRYFVVALTALILPALYGAVACAADEPAKKNDAAAPAADKSPGTPPGTPGEPFPLWLDGAPGAKGQGEDHTPALTAYLPDPAAATKVAIVVCPGGGYAGLAMDHEGLQIAQWCNAHGIAAFVLRYRHAPAYMHPTPLMDARRAVRTVRAYAEGWGIDPARIGMIGFSAGGHLTATAETQFEAGNPSAPDPIERVSSRPDFAILLYPVITMTDPYTHQGSRKNLLGPKPDPLLIDALSAEQRVTKDTPPTFLVHTTEDEAVPVMNSILFYSALVKAGVPAELHVFQKGHHGLGLAKDDPAMHVWPDMCIAWLKVRGILQ